MITDELLEFIRTQRAASMSLEEIDRLLITEGEWDHADVLEGFSALAIIPPASMIPKEPEKIPEAPPTPPSLEEVPTPLPPPDVHFSLDEALKEEKKIIQEPEATITQATNLASEGESPAEMTAPIIIPVIEVAIPVEVALGAESPTVKVSPPNAGLEIPSLHEHTPEVIPEAKKISSTSTTEMWLKNLSTGLEEVSDAREESADFVVAPEVAEEVTSIPIPEILFTPPPVVSTSEVMTPTVLVSPTQETSTPEVTPVQTSTSKVPHKPLAARRTMSSDLSDLTTGEVPVTGVPIPAVEAEGVLTPVSSESLVMQKQLIPTEATVTGTPIDSAPASIPGIVEDKKSRRVLTIAIGALALLLLIGGVVFFVVSRSSNGMTLVANAFSSLSHLSSLSYKGTGSTDIVFTTPVSGAVMGTSKFTMTYEGQVKENNGAFGDGVHRLKFKGGFQFGNFAWSTDAEADVLILGDTLYLHIISLPQGSNLNPDLFKTYWIKMPLADVAKQFALADTSVSGSGYGNFAGTDGGGTFLETLTKNFPFLTADTPIEEATAGKVLLHFHPKINPDNMVAVATFMYQRLTAQNLTLDAQAALKLKSMAEKITAEVTIDKATGALDGLTLGADWDDDMNNLHVKGPFHLALTVSDFEKTLVLPAHTPEITLDEMRAHIDQDKKIADARTRDQARIDNLHFIVSALETYKTQKTRYPIFLTDLIQSGVIATSSMATSTLSLFYYDTYKTSTKLTKDGRCTAKGSCDVYHVGIDLEDMTNPELANDSDQTTSVLGKDTAGCTGAQNVACYDIVSPSFILAPSSATSTATSTPGKVQ